jgi:hypothetical protein
MTLSLIAAVAGAVLYGAGSVLQAVAVRRSGGLRALSQPLYLAGLGCDGAAWLASLVALRALPLFTVQAVLAGSLAVTVLLARFVLRALLRPIDVVAVGVVIAALVALALAAGPGDGSQGGAAFVPSWFAAAMLGSLAVLALATALTYRRGAGLWFATLAGLASSGAAIAVRATHLDAKFDGQAFVDVARQPLAWAVVGFGALTAVTFARALERAAVGPSTALLSVVDVVVPGAVGLAVLHDVMRAGWAPGAAAATVAALASCVVLAMSPATHATRATRATR